MAKKEDINDGNKDIVNRINKAAKNFEELVSSSSSFKRNLQDVLLVSADLQKNFSSSKDLFQKMKSDSKLFHKVEKDLLKIQGDKFKFALKAFKEEVKKFGFTKTTIAMIKSMDEKRLKLQKNISENLERQLKLIKLHHKEAKGLVATTKDFVQKVKAKEGFVAAGFGTIAGVIIESVKSIWSALDKYLLPAGAEFERSIGNTNEVTGRLKKQMNATGFAFQRLGLDFHEGAGIIRDVSAAMGTLKFPEELTAPTGPAVRLVKTFGIGSQEAARLSKAFLMSTGELTGLNETMNKANELANQYIVPLGRIGKEMADNIDLLARFGTRNRMVMAESITKTLDLGLSVKDVNAAFGKQMDTFEGTSKVSAKLNAVFGTHINSYRLMLETDPTSRMIMLRDELAKHGKTWDLLNVQEKNVITTQLQVSDEFAQIAFSSGDARKKLDQYAQKQKNTIEVNKRWEEGLGRVREMVINWPILMERMLRSIGKLIFKLFKIKEPFSATLKGGQLFEKVITEIMNGIDKMDVTPIADLGKFVKDLDVTKINGIADSVKRLAVAVDVLTAPLRGLAELTEVPGIVKELFTGKSESQNIMEGIESAFKAAKKSGAGLTRKEFSDIESQFAEELESLSSPVRAHFLSKFQEQIVDDALITKKGQVIKFHPQDNILATKSPIKQSGGGFATGGKSSEERIIIMPAPIYLDGKQIAEVVFSQGVKAASRGG